MGVDSGEHGICGCDSCTEPSVASTRHFRENSHFKSAPGAVAKGGTCDLFCCCPGRDFIGDPGLLRLNGNIVPVEPVGVARPLFSMLSCRLVLWMLLRLSEQLGLEAGEVLDVLPRGREAGGGTFGGISAECLRPELDSENTGLVDEDCGLPAATPPSNSHAWMATG